MNTSTTLRSAVAARGSQSQRTQLFSSLQALRNETQPESPRYINIPQPVQESLPSRPRVKGFLPVPRTLFGGKADDEDFLRQRLRTASRVGPIVTPSRGARAVWERRMANSRKRNLLEGTLELKNRKDAFDQRRDETSRQRADDREKTLQAAMREDERLTTQSNNFDVQQTLSRKPLPEMMRLRRRRYNTLEHKKSEQRQRDLHSLYTKAQSFIVEPQQLDEAVETAFGTDEDPVIFEAPFKPIDKAHSVWNYGKPLKLADMAEALEKHNTAIARGGTRGSALEDLKTARLTRIVETLTGGELGDDLTKTKKRS